LGKKTETRPGKKLAVVVATKQIIVDIHPKEGINNDHA
jgi:hypothetical protein